VNAAALLAELTASGIHVTRIGDNLRVRAAPGVSIATHRERLKTQKPALLKELLRQQIVAAATVESQNFDRATYDHLWALWQSQHTAEDSTR
jgi:hypothetical protein